MRAATPASDRELNLKYHIRHHWTTTHSSTRCDSHSLNYNDSFAITQFPPTTAMIRTSLRRFYSTTQKQTTKARKPVSLARPIKPRPIPAPRKPIAPLKEPDLPISLTLWESTQVTLSSFSINPRRWWQGLVRKEHGKEVFKRRLDEFHGGGDRSFFRTFLHTFWLCVVASVWIFIPGHLIQTHLYEMKATYGPSMLPTVYFEGDWVIINKLYRRGKGVQVGDLVEAKDPLTPEGRVLKRVIGMPGDFVVAHTVETDGEMIQVWCPRILRLSGD